jgi:transcriptional antiterminator RfaH
MELEDARAGVRWYVVSTKPRQELRAASNLLAWNVETFYPRLKRAGGARRGDEPVQLPRPLFPGYIFARFDADAMLNKVRFTRGVNGVVCFGDRAAPVEDAVIEIIRRRQDESGQVVIGEGPRAAPPTGGPLMSFAAMFERPHGERERVEILLATVGVGGHPAVAPGRRNKAV